jgi:hypothetical protein
LTQGFQIFPQLPVNLEHRRPPAEPLRLLPFGVGGWLALLVASIIVFCPIKFSFRVFEEFRPIQAAGFALLTPVLYRASIWSFASDWQRAAFSRVGLF